MFKYFGKIIVISVLSFIIFINQFNPIWHALLILHYFANSKFLYTTENFLD